MYQSHVLIILATIFSHLENKSRKDVISELAECSPSHTYFSKYKSYIGIADTRCEVSFRYKHIQINVSCGKKLTDEKSLCLVTSDLNYMCIDLSNNTGNPYDVIFNWLNDNLHPFLSNDEIRLLWKHIKSI